MITNIFLGLILCVVITTFIIINNKIINLYKLLNKITNIELTTNNTITETLKLFSNLVDRFNDFVLRYNELNGLLETKVNHNIEYFDKTLTSINDKISEINEHFEIVKDLIDKNKLETHNTQELLYNLPVRLETFIAEENDTIRNNIKKLAKISSKKKQASKQTKSINK